MNNKIRELVFTGLVVGISVVTRIGMAALPNVQITTFLIIAMTILFGWKRGVAVAVLTPIVSNFFMGQGLWTVSQAITWGVIALLSNLGLRPFKDRKHFMAIGAIFSYLSGHMFGLIMGLFDMMFFGIPINGLPAYYMAGIPFDVIHGINNLVFFIILYPVLNFIVKKR